MNSSSPLDDLGLVGEALIRGMMIVRPTEDVQRLLPRGLELGQQSITPPGTHPIVLHFNEMFGARTVLPSLFQNITYHETILGIPHTWTKVDLFNGPRAGPFFFMPRLLVDNLLVMLGGILNWSFPKRMGRFTVSHGRYEVATSAGQKLATFAFAASGETRAVKDYAPFQPVREIMDQPVVTELPFGLGPCLVASNFDKFWDDAQLRPLTTSTELATEIVPGFPVGRFPATGESEGVDKTPQGSFEVRARWRLGLPRQVWLPREAWPGFSAGAR